MIVKIDHIGKVVNELESSRNFYESLGFKMKYYFEKEEHGYRAIYLKKGKDAIEIFEFEDKKNPYAKQINGHTAIITDNIKADLKKFIKEGYKIISPIKKGITARKYASVKNETHSFELLQK
jgi:catechol 2,3-dioxygenase-like lactoylglutathione lyase family enzyme